MSVLLHSCLISLNFSCSWSPFFCFAFLGKNLYTNEYVAIKLVSTLFIIFYQVITTTVVDVLHVCRPGVELKFQLIKKATPTDVF